MDKYSNKSVAQHTNAQIFLATWQASEARTKAKAAHLRQIACEAHQRQADDRRREQTRERVARHRASRQRTWEPHPVDRDRLKAEMQALRMWLQEDGRPQRKLRLRAKEIGLARAVYTEHVARTGEEPTHREMAEAMTARTGNTWTTRQGRNALDWIAALEQAGAWKPLTRAVDLIELDPALEAALAELDA